MVTIAPPSSQQSAMRPPPLALSRIDEVEEPKVEGSTTEKRQQHACAECRRLKLKCSRTVPCSSCVKRGCAQICPTGEMRSGKGKRLILAETEELHERISQLENALARSHAKNDTAPHPLLTSPYLFSSRDKNAFGKAGLVVMEDEDDIIEGGFGMLTINPHGEARFVGSYAGSEYLREKETADKVEDTTGLNTPPPTAHAPHFGLTQPQVFVDGLAAEVERCRGHLPNWDHEGQFLAKSYWENVDWMYHIIPRPMFDRDHLAHAYDLPAPAQAHKIACVFFVMALGAMFDLTRKPFDARAETLFQLGKTCLYAVGLDRASPATVQAFHLCGTYMLNDKDGRGSESFWPMLGTAVKVAQSLGLHRDGAAFGLSEYEIEERRQVWWELLTYDRLQALCFGRPCATANRHADTLYPTPDQALCVDVDSYHRTKYRLIQMIEKVIDLQTQTTPVSVVQVNQLDQELREFKASVPENLLPHTPIQSLPMDPSDHPHLVIHRLSLRLLIAQTRLLLNRPSFTKALNESPQDPTLGKAGDSFVSLFEAAQEIVQIVKQLVIYHPSLIARWWFFWFHAFTASVCLAAITIRAPGSAFASPAFLGMSIVCDIAYAAQADCRAKKGLPILMRLRERATAALVSSKRTNYSAPFAGTADDDDLHHLSASAKLYRVEQNLPSHNTPPLQQPAIINLPTMPGYQLPGISNASPNQALNNSSPQSARSSATSITYVDPMYYDPILGSLQPVEPLPFNPQGAVPPPPPLATENMIQNPGPEVNPFMTTLTPLSDHRTMTFDWQIPSSTQITPLSDVNVEVSPYRQYVNIAEEWTAMGDADVTMAFGMGGSRNGDQQHQAFHPGGEFSAQGEMSDIDIFISQLVEQYGNTGHQ